jgi:hypothetical protein
MVLKQLLTEKLDALALKRLTLVKLGRHGLLCAIIL